MRAFPCLGRDYAGVFRNRTQPIRTVNPEIPDVEKTGSRRGEEDVTLEPIHVQLGSIVMLKYERGHIFCVVGFMSFVSLFARVCIYKYDNRVRTFYGFSSTRLGYKI